jgi:hypothetical protein
MASKRRQQATKYLDIIVGVEQHSRRRRRVQEVPIHDGVRVSLYGQSLDVLNPGALQALGDPAGGPVDMLLVAWQGRDGWDAH